MRNTIQAGDIALPLTLIPPAPGTSRRPTAVTVALRLGAWLRRAVDDWSQQRQARALHLSLREVDDRTLRDVGLDRREFHSDAAVLGSAFAPLLTHAFR
jgi:uncharacterized protein YjiS (DUF1127 family)